MHISTEFERKHGPPDPKLQNRDSEEAKQANSTQEPMNKHEQSVCLDGIRLCPRPVPVLRRRIPLLARTRGQRPHLRNLVCRLLRPRGVRP